MAIVRVTWWPTVVTVGIIASTTSSALASIQSSSRVRLALGPVLALHHCSSTSCRNR